MALNEIQPVNKKGSDGGGLFGSLLGGTLGLVAGAGLAPVTGGGSLLAVGAATAGAAAAGGSAGMTAGNILGELVKPTEGGSAGQSVSLSNTKRAPLTAMADSPEVQLAQITSAKKQIPGSSLPGSRADEYMRMLGEAEGKLKNRLGI